MVAIVGSLVVLFVCVQCTQWLYERVLFVRVEGEGWRPRIHVVLYILLWTWLMLQARMPIKHVGLMLCVMLGGLIVIRVIDRFLMVKQHLSLVAVVVRMYFFALMGMTVMMTYLNLARLNY